MEYEQYERSGKIVTNVAKYALDDIIRDWFEEEVGYKLVQSPIDKQPKYKYDEPPFSADVNPNEREIRNVRYNGTLIQVQVVCENPDWLTGIGQDIREKWEDRFGTGYTSSPPPDGLDQIDAHLEQIEDYKEFIFENPQLEDFIKVIEAGHYRNAAEMLNDPDLNLFEYGAPSHELRELFTNGEVHVIYRDGEIALLKPEMDWDIFGERVIVQETAEPAFVVGVDDTPVGLFGHVVDGTNLDYDQHVTRGMIQDIMGFDRDYMGDEVLGGQSGTRIRLQGDLAIRMGEGPIMSDYPGQCNVPIDNHLVVLESGEIVDDRDQEPISVIVGGEPTTMTVIHDEHEQVTCKLEPGRYEFYLLPRGIQDEHPDW